MRNPKSEIRPYGWDTERDGTRFRVYVDEDGGLWAPDPDVGAGALCPHGWDEDAAFVYYEIDDLSTLIRVPGLTG